MSTADVQHDGPWSDRSGGRGWLRVAKQTNNPLLRHPTPRERLAKRISLVLLALAVLAVVLGSSLVYRTGRAAERADAGRHQVKVTVLRPLETAEPKDGYPSDVTLEVSYQFDGVTRTATIPTLFGAAAGTKIDAWADDDGHLVARPQTAPATAAQTTLAGVGGAVLLVCLVIGGRGALAAWSMRLRSREWEAEWREFDAHRSR